MSNIEVYPPELRRHQVEEKEGPNVDWMRSLLDQIVRVKMNDKRIFIGTLKTIDEGMNLVVAAPIEYRPIFHKGFNDDGSAVDYETKGQRGCLLLRGVDIDTVGIIRDDAKDELVEDDDAGERSDQADDKATADTDVDRKDSKEAVDAEVPTPETGGD